MENILRMRVRERLDALCLNPFEAARRIPAERSFLNDLLIGKKDTIRYGTIPSVAEVLECDPEYLLGAQDAPRRSGVPPLPTAAPHGEAGYLRLAGVVEMGTWRAAGHSELESQNPLAADPRYPISAQAAYLVRGSHAEGLGILDGSILLAVLGAPYRDGDTVIVRRGRIGEDGPEEEITVCQIRDNQIIAINKYTSTTNVSFELCDILARVISSHKFF